MSRDIKARYGFSIRRPLKTLPHLVVLRGWDYV